MRSTEQDSAYSLADLVIRSSIGLAAAAVVLVSFLAPGMRNLHTGAKPASKQEWQALSQPQKAQLEQPAPAPAPGTNRTVDQGRHLTRDGTRLSAHESKAASRIGRQRTGEIAEAVDGREGFVPLMYGGALNPMEGGQLVRIKLSRSMLASFGLALNMDMADESVRADVVLGNDGVPRSIRLIDNRLQSR
jgi:hypothetical protein